MGNFTRMSPKEKSYTTINKQRLQQSPPEDSFCSPLRPIFSSHLLQSPPAAISFLDIEDEGKIAPNDDASFVIIEEDYESSPNKPQKIS